MMDKKFQLKPNPEISKEINKMIIEALDEFLEECKKVCRKKGKKTELIFNSKGIIIKSFQIFLNSLLIYS